MAWHAWHGIRTKPTVRSWWPPSCFTWCPSAPSQAICTDLASFFADAATSPKRYREPGELAQNRFLPHTAQGLWVATQPLAGLWVAPTFLHATTRPKQLFIDATVIDTTNTHYTR